MNRNCLFIFVVAALSGLYSATAQGGFFYQFAGLPVAPVAPGTNVQVQVLLAEADTTVLSGGIIAASVQIAPVSGLVLNEITSGADWEFFDSQVGTGYWDGSTGPTGSVTTNPVLLATYSFTANQTSTFTAVDPLVLSSDGSVFDVNFNTYLVESASATITVVPEPSTCIGWGSALFTVGAFSWVRTRRSRRIQRSRLQA